MRHITAFIFFLITAPALADMNGATWALMDEKTIKYMETRGESDFPTLLVAVVDDGTQRYGFAEYICLVLAEHDVRSALVKIIDYKPFSKNNREEVELGAAICRL